jgi:imidazolonepropionase-like amidohydrolase
LLGLIEAEGLAVGAERFKAARATRQDKPKTAIGTDDQVIF